MNSAVRNDFPIFKKAKNLVYLDSTATALKPQCVIDAMVDYYSSYSANVFRGIYKISEQATEEYEKSRLVVAKFIGAQFSEEILFTRSTTESINLIAYSLAKKIVKRGDEIATTVMEHHSNFVPWQMLANESGANLKVINITPEGYLDLYKRHTKGINIKKIVTKKTKILALTGASNVLGTVNPVREIVRKAKSLNPSIITIIDGAQMAPHEKIEVKSLGCDFFAFSGHKVCGPTGIGVLWGKRDVLEKMNPFNYGGEMIERVAVENTTFAPLPHKFEAGTPHIAGVIGLGRALTYIECIGLPLIVKHERTLYKHARKEMERVFGDALTIYGPRSARDRVGILAFTLAGTHPHDLATLLDENGVAIRVGSHCAMPLHKRLGVIATARASFYLYNTEDDVDYFVSSLKKAYKKLT